MNLFKQIDILAPEYPGYGLYKGKTKASKLISDAQDVIDYATKTDGLNYSIIAGMSLTSSGEDSSRHGFVFISIRYGFKLSSIIKSSPNS